MNEEIYIAGLHRGDESVFRMIFEKYHTRLCYFASRLLPAGEGCEDAVQETFVKLWKKRTDFPDQQSVKAFLYITVKNHCLNVYKHDKVVKKYGDLLQHETQQGDVTEHFIESEVFETVYQALQKLPAGCRNILRLSYFEGMKNKAIANHLHVSINTVKTQKTRGLHLLRSLLKNSFVLLLLSPFL